MAVHEKQTPGRRWQLNLRTLFASVTCFAVGLSCTGHWLDFGLIGTAAAALVYGLLQESAAIYRGLRTTDHNLPHENGPKWIGIAWRCGVAAIIVGSLAEFSMRGGGAIGVTDSWVFTFLWSEYLYLAAVLLGYSSSWRRWRTDNDVPWRFSTIAPVAFAAATLALVVANKFEIANLVHDAVEQTEKSHAGWLQRNWAYPDHAEEGYRFFWTACLAAVCVCISFGGFVALCRGGTKLTGKKLLLLLILSCQAYLMGYLVWFYKSELHHVSPDLAGAGLQSNAAEWLQAAILLAIGALAASYVLAAETACVDRLVPTGTVSLHETWPMILALLAGSAAACVEFIRIVNAPSPQGIAIITQARWLVEPYVLLLFALLLVGSRLALQRWKHGGGLPPIRLPQVSVARFFGALVGLALITSTGIPALAAFGFAIWFAPWVR